MDSVFQSKYNEFVDDLIGAIPEYTAQLTTAKGLDPAVRLARFKECVKVDIRSEAIHNPGTILPGVEISNSMWSTLSENTQKTIWEYVRVLTMCSFMEGFGNDSKPEWMDDAMNEMKKKLEGMDFDNILKKFMKMFGSDSTSSGSDSTRSGFEKMFENGFPKIPERFLKGHMAKLAQEIVKDIKPEDLGIDKEMIDECEKNPSRAFDILFKVFGNNPDILQKTVQKIGNRLQQKIKSGAIKPEVIAREAEELMKEFSGNSSFVDMMDGIKKAFGFEDMDLARQAGKEGTARMSIVKERLKKKAAEKAARNTNVDTVDPSKVLAADKMMESLLRSEKKHKKKK